MEKEELENMRRVIRLTMIRIGIRCDMVGFRYLCHGVELVIKDQNLLHNLCKRLYPEIAEEYAVENICSVERGMRHAIENTYINKSFGELNKLFKTQLYTIDDKPTVGELIELVAQYYLLGLYKENI